MSHEADRAAKLEVLVEDIRKPFALHEETRAAIDQYRQLQIENTALKKEREALSHLVKEWGCDTCKIAYPGPPQKGTACVMCPNCGGKTMPLEKLLHRNELAAAQVRAAELEAERDKLTLVLAERTVERDALRKERDEALAQVSWRTPREAMQGYKNWRYEFCAD